MGSTSGYAQTMQIFEQWVTSTAIPTKDGEKNIVYGFLGPYAESRTNRFLNHVNAGEYGIQFRLMMDPSDCQVVARIDPDNTDGHVCKAKLLEGEITLDENMEVIHSRLERMNVRGLRYFCGRFGVLPAYNHQPSAEKPMDEIVTELITNHHPSNEAKKRVDWDGRKFIYTIDGELVAYGLPDEKNPITCYVVNKQPAEVHKGELVADIVAKVPHLVRLYHERGHELMPESLSERIIAAQASFDRAFEMFFYPHSDE